jgi:glutaredoxin
MMDVTILSRANCHLCHVVLKMARKLQEEVPFHLREVDIDGDEGLTARYEMKIPVVLIDEVERLAGKITEGDLRRAIKRARWRRPISRILSRFGWSPPRG